MRVLVLTGSLRSLIVIVRAMLLSARSIFMDLGVGRGGWSVLDKPGQGSLQLAERQNN